MRFNSHMARIQILATARLYSIKIIIINNNIVHTEYEFECLTIFLSLSDVVCVCVCVCVCQSVCWRYFFSVPPLKVIIVYNYNTGGYFNWFGNISRLPVTRLAIRGYPIVKIIAAARDGRVLYGRIKINRSFHYWNYYY